MQKGFGDRNALKTFNYKPDNNKCIKWGADLKTIVHLDNGVKYGYRKRLDI